MLNNLFYLYFNHHPPIQRHDVYVHSSLKKCAVTNQVRATGYYIQFGIRCGIHFIRRKLFEYIEKSTLRPTDETTFTRSRRRNTKEYPNQVSPERAVRAFNQGQARAVQEGRFQKNQFFTGNWDYGMQNL